MAKRTRRTTRAARPRRSRTGKAAGDNLAGTKLDGLSVREMTAEFNRLVPEARKLGLKHRWVKEHVSPFESRTAAARMLGQLTVAMRAEAR
jgi:hypothetical protein